MPNERVVIVVDAEATAVRLVRGSATALAAVTTAARRRVEVKRMKEGLRNRTKGARTDSNRRVPRAHLAERMIRPGRSVAVLTGLEPATSALTGRRALQLLHRTSYYVP